MVTTPQEILDNATKNAKQVRKLLEQTPYIPPASVTVPAASGVTPPTPPVGQPTPSTGS